MASTVEALERDANAKFVDEEYEEAVEIYTKAIEEDPARGSLYISRAAAHIQLESFTEAISDANKAIELDPSISKAYLRKGIACYHLEEYLTAKAAFENGARLDPSNAQFKSWIAKCEAKMLDEAGGTPNSNGYGTSGANGHTPTDTQVSTSLPAAAVAPAPVTGPPAYKLDYYQSASQVVVVILAKGVRQEDLSVDIGPQILQIRINSGDQEPYTRTIRLFAKVDPATSKTVLMSTKIEIRLTKASAINWPSLEFSPEKAVVLQPINVSDEKAADVKKKYPSSSKARRDWDSLEAEVKKEEKDEKLDGDAALNKLFQDIYRNADEDTRRAMNKSFVESNGTTLSTNWKEVGAKYVEGQAPQGMEMHKWNE